MAHQQIAFGPFALDPARGALTRDGKPVAIGQRGMALLQALLEANGEVVAKGELVERAWPGTFVEEGNLTVQIAALRKALGTAPGGHDWIATVPRVGYRLVRLGGPLGDADPLADQPALAVLPFQNLGGDPEQDYFADGVVAEIITALGRFRSFAVVSRNSSFVYKGRSVDVRCVAAELGVRYVLEGSVRRGGDRLRITAQLIDGASGAQLWAEHFDGSPADIFDFQDRITERVAMEVEPHVQLAEVARSRIERPGSLAAYDIYLRALAKISNRIADDNAAAIALLTEGLELEPDNAMLLAHTAWALDHRSAMGWPPIGPDDRQKCAELARRGLQHGAGNATVMAHCGVALLQSAKEYELGMAVVRSAAEANPNSLLVASLAGIAHLHCGSIEEALAWFHRAVRLSPLDPFAFTRFVGSPMHIWHWATIRRRSSGPLVRLRSILSSTAPSGWRQPPMPISGACQRRRGSSQP